MRGTRAPRSLFSHVARGSPKAGNTGPGSVSFPVSWQPLRAPFSLRPSPIQLPQDWRGRTGTSVAAESHRDKTTQAQLSRNTFNGQKGPRSSCPPRPPKGTVGGGAPAPHEEGRNPHPARMASEAQAAAPTPHIATGASAAEVLLPRSPPPRNKQECCHLLSSVSTPPPFHIHASGACGQRVFARHLRSLSLAQLPLIAQGKNTQGTKAAAGGEGDGKLSALPATVAAFLLQVQPPPWNQALAPLPLGVGERFGPHQ